MPTDDFTVSVTQNVLTDLAAGRPWQVGAYISASVVYAPAAATSFEWSLFGDGVEIVPRGTQSAGTAPSATPSSEDKVIDYTAESQWRAPCQHAGAAAQTIRMRVEYEAVVPVGVQAAQD
ncbi:MAG: hypothetical protein ACREBU_07485 [Nitrososphaera sp.]